MNFNPFHSSVTFHIGTSHLFCRIKQMTGFFTKCNTELKWVSLYISLREKYRYSEFFWSVFFRIWTEYEEIRSISLYSVRIRENTDQKNSEYGHFSCSISPWYGVASLFEKVALSLFSIQLLFSKNGNGGLDLSQLIFFLSMCAKIVRRT